VNKVIFLDIDGVLNNASYAKLLHHLYGGNGYGGFAKGRFTTKDIKWDLYNVGALKTLMNKTGAKIVISSTWRYTHSVNSFKDMFQLYGLKAGRIIGLTPDLSHMGITDKFPKGTIRGDDINAYLKDHDVDNYVILDDDGDFYKDQNLIQTDATYGLTDSDALKAIGILNASNK